MESWNLFLNRNLIFGEGSLNGKLLPKITTDFLPTVKIASVVLITGKSLASHPEVVQFQEGLKKASIAVSCFTQSGEPYYQNVDAIMEKLQAQKKTAIDAVIAIGGGSVLDTGKAISFLLKEQGSLLEFLEGVGVKTPSGEKVPFIAVPTTAGTGSEATKNGVINGNKEGKPFKKSFRHDRFIPDMAVIDPLLFTTCPISVIASSGMDCISQLIEAFTSTAATPFTDAIAESGMILAAESFDYLLVNRDDVEEWGKMAYAAWCSGVALGNADLGAVHGIAGVLGGYYKIPHGTACAILLPVVVEALIRNLAVDAKLGTPSFRFLVKLARCGYLLCGEMESGFDIGEGCKKLLKRLSAWIKDFQLGSLSDYGVALDEIEKLSLECKNRKSPVAFTAKEFEAILRCATTQEPLLLPKSDRKNSFSSHHTEDCNGLHDCCDCCDHSDEENCDCGCEDSLR